jgi:hypothetical protein
MERGQGRGRRWAGLVSDGLCEQRDSSETEGACSWLGLGGMQCSGTEVPTRRAGRRGEARQWQAKSARDSQSTHAPTGREASLQIQDVECKTCVFPRGGSVVGIVGFGGDSLGLEAA